MGRLRPWGARFQRRPKRELATVDLDVDGKDNVWVFHRCEDGGCAVSSVAPIWELSPEGKASRCASERPPRMNARTLT